MAVTGYKAKQRATTRRRVADAQMATAEDRLRKWATRRAASPECYAPTHRQVALDVLEVLAKVPKPKKARVAPGQGQLVA